MSPSVDLQDAILGILRTDSAVSGFVEQRVYDHAPEGAEYPHITFGPSDFLPDDADCITGRVETVQIDIWSRDQGRKWPCKQIVDAVKSALHEADADLGASALVEMRVSLARVLDDPDGITCHGVVQVEAMIEEG